METKNLLTRTERRAKRQELQKAIKASLKNICKGTAALVVSASLVSGTLNLPYIGAYFTDKIIYSESPRLGRSLNSAGMGPLRLFFDVYTFNTLDVSLELEQDEDILLAGITLPRDCGFTASDIIIESVKLYYSDGKSKGVTPDQVRPQGNRLVMQFSWSEVSDLIDSEDNDPGFEVAGKGAGPGASGLGEKFTFEGYGEINDLASYFAVPEPEIPEEPAEPAEETLEENAGENGDASTLIAAESAQNAADGDTGTAVGSPAQGEGDGEPSGDTPAPNGEDVGMGNGSDSEPAGDTVTSGGETENDRDGRQTDNVSAPGEGDNVQDSVSGNSGGGEATPTSAPAPEPEPAQTTKPVEDNDGNSAEGDLS